jgi:hypothetical protein
MPIGKIRTQQEEEFCVYLTLARTYQERRQPNRIQHWWEEIMDDLSTGPEPPWRYILDEFEKTYYRLEPEMQTQYYDVFLEEMGGVMLYCWLERYNEEKEIR